MPKVTSRAAAASKRSARKPSRLKTSGRKSLPKGATRKIARKRPGMAGRQAAELERYRLALESMNLNTYDWDIVNNVVYISPAMREAVGFGPDQPFSLENWQDFIHPEDRPLYRAALVSLLKGETARFDCEYRYRARDGSWRWIRQHGLVARGRNGRAIRMVGAAGDITDLKRRERAVQSAQAEVEVAQRGVEQAREAMQLVLDNISDGVVLADNNLDLKFANRRFVEFLQLPPEIVSSGRGYDVLRFQAKRGDFGPVESEKDLERIVQERAAMLRMPTFRRYERRMGNDRYVEASFRQLADGSVLGFYRDITARKEREQALAAAKEAAETARDEAERARAATSAARNDVERAYQMTQSILDNLSDGVVLADKHFYLKFANRHFAEFLQIPAEIARPGRSAYDVLRFLARRGDFGSVESERTSNGSFKSVPPSSARSAGLATNGAWAMAVTWNLISNNWPTRACLDSIATSRRSRNARRRWRPQRRPPKPRATRPSRRRPKH